jgi:hypothetical protein
MDCLDCGRSLDLSDLAAGSCQSCGEPLLPDDIKNLEAKLNIVKEVPEVDAPVLLPEGGIKVPDMMECKNCGYPLYGDDLNSYMNGGNCNYCNTPDPDAVVSQPVVESQPMAEQESEVTETDSSEQSLSEFSKEGGIRVRLCTGPLAGFQFNLPTSDILGREFFNKILSEQYNKIAASHNVTALNPPPSKDWYAKSIARISRDHFKIAEDGTIEDMGSANSTFLDRQEVFGEGDAFELGMVLSIADELMLTRVHSEEDGPGITITHAQTGISIDVPSGKKFHLGRLREDGRREPFGFAITDHMKRMDGMDHDDLRRISRRHATVEINSNGDISIENIDGKPVSILAMQHYQSTILYDESHTEQLDLDASTTNYCTSTHDERIEITIGKMTFIITRNA